MCQVPDLWKVLIKKKMTINLEIEETLGRILTNILRLLEGNNRKIDFII